MRKIIAFLCPLVCLYAGGSAQAPAWTWSTVKAAVAGNCARVKTLSADMDAVLGGPYGSWRGSYRLFYRQPHEVKIVSKADPSHWYYRNKQVTQSEMGDDILISLVVSSLQVDSNGLIFDPLLQVLGEDSAAVSMRGDTVHASLKHVRASDGANAYADYDADFVPATGTVARVDVAAFNNGTLLYDYAVFDSARIPTSLKMYTQGDFTRTLKDVRVNYDLGDSISVAALPRPARPSRAPRGRSGRGHRYDLQGRVREAAGSALYLLAFPSIP